MFEKDEKKGVSVCENASPGVSSESRGFRLQFVEKIVHCLNVETARLW